MDPKFIRLQNVDPFAGKPEGEPDPLAHEVIDEIYSEVRFAVDKEISQVDAIFLREAARDDGC